MLSKWKLVIYAKPHEPDAHRKLQQTRYLPNVQSYFQAMKLIILGKLWNVGPLLCLLVFTRAVQLSNEGKTIKSHEIRFVIFHVAMKLDFIITHYQRHHHYHQQQQWIVAMLLLLGGGIGVCLSVVTYFLLLCVFHQNETLCVLCSSLVKPKLKLNRSTDNNKGTKMLRSNLRKVFLSVFVALLCLWKRQQTKAKSIFHFLDYVFTLLCACVCLHVCLLVRFVWIFLYAVVPHCTGDNNSNLKNKK